MVHEIVQNWIFDRLNGALPEAKFDLPLLQLLKCREEKDKERSRGMCCGAWEQLKGRVGG